MHKEREGERCVHCYFLFLQTRHRCKNHCAVTAHMHTRLYINTSMVIHRQMHAERMREGAISMFQASLHRRPGKEVINLDEELHVASHMNEEARICIPVSMLAVHMNKVDSRPTCRMIHKELEEMKRRIQLGSSCQVHLVGVCVCFWKRFDRCPGTGNVLILTPFSEKHKEICVFFNAKTEFETGSPAFVEVSFSEPL